MCANLGTHLPQLIPLPNIWVIQHVLQELQLQIVISHLPHQPTLQPPQSLLVEHVNQSMQELIVAEPAPVLLLIIAIY